MGRSALALAALVTAISPACLGGTAPAPPAAGIVSGRVVTVRTTGGLIGAERPPIVPAPSADVVITGRTSAGRRLVRYVHADVRGRFRVRLPAGAYALRPLAGSSPPAPVRVDSGRTTRIELTETPPVTQKGVTLEMVE